MDEVRRCTRRLERAGECREDAVSGARYMAIEDVFAGRPGNCRTEPASRSLSCMFAVVPVLRIKPTVQC
jgi:hypothetical protein